MTKETQVVSVGGKTVKQERLQCVKGQSVDTAPQ